MATNVISKGSERWQLWMDLFDLDKKYGIPERNDEYWTQVIHAVDAVAEKYDSDLFALEMLYGFLNALEAVDRGHSVSATKSY